MLNQNVNLAGIPLVPQAQAMPAAAPIQIQARKPYQAPVSNGEAIAKVLQSYMDARQKDAILNNAMGNTGMSIGDTNYTGGSNAYDAITGSQTNKPNGSMDWLKNMFAGS
jgi:hypothetical protein